MFKLQRKLRAASCFMQYGGGGANLCTGLDSQVEDDESAPPPRVAVACRKKEKGKKKSKKRAAGFSLILRIVWDEMATPIGARG